MLKIQEVRYRATGTLTYYRWKRNTVLLLSENSVAVSYKGKNTLPWPQSPLLVIHSRQIKVHAHTKTCTLMYVMALFITDPNQKQPKRPSVGKGLDKHPCDGNFLHNKEAKYWSTEVWGSLDGTLRHCTAALSRSVVSDPLQPHGL